MSIPEKHRRITTSSMAQNSRSTDEETSCPGSARKPTSVGSVATGTRVLHARDPATSHPRTSAKPLPSPKKAPTAQRHNCLTAPFDYPKRRDRDHPTPHTKANKTYAGVWAGHRPGAPTRSRVLRAFLEVWKRQEENALANNREEEARRPTSRQAGTRC